MPKKAETEHFNTSHGRYERRTVGALVANLAEYPPNMPAQLHLTTTNGGKYIRAFFGEVQVSNNAVTIKVLGDAEDRIEQAEHIANKQTKKVPAHVYTDGQKRHLLRAYLKGAEEVYGNTKFPIAALIPDNASPDLARDLVAQFEQGYAYAMERIGKANDPRVNL